jgi:hypothetical protein
MTLRGNGLCRIEGNKSENKQNEGTERDVLDPCARKSSLMRENMNEHCDICIGSGATASAGDKSATPTPIGTRRESHNDCNMDAKMQSAASVTIGAEAGGINGKNLRRRRTIARNGSSTVRC